LAVFAGGSFPARLVLALFSLLLLFGLSTLFGCLRSLERSVPDEFSLLDGPFSSNLNITSAEAPPLRFESAPKPRVDFGKVAVERPPQVKPRRMTFAEPAVIRLTGATEPMTGDFVSFNSHRGDTPMLSTWKRLGLHTLLAAMFAVAQAPAAPPSDSDKLDEIQKQLNELKKSVSTIQKSLELLQAMGTDLRNLRTESRQGVENAEKQIGDLKRELGTLRDELDKLGTRMNTTTRIAASPPTEPPVATGRVEMTNTFSDEVTVAVNHRTYRLVPGERRMSDPIPAGTFTYEVLGITPPRTRTLTANQVFTVNVYTLP
jgi:hypothetical protein